MLPMAVAYEHDSQVTLPGRDIDCNSAALYGTGRSNHHGRFQEGLLRMAVRG